MDGGFLHEIQRATVAIRDHGLPPLEFAVSRSRWSEGGADAFQISIQRHGSAANVYLMTPLIDWLDAFGQDLRAGLYGTVS